MTETEIILTAGSWSAIVSNFGASLRRFWSSPGRDWLWGYQGGTKHKLGGQGDILIPFPGRLRAGQYHFQGRPHQLTINDKEGPNAIHGFVRAKVWDTLGVTETEARFRTRIEGVAGYPFTIEAEVGYRLDSTGQLNTFFSLRNSGDGAAPVGAGFHPYFSPGALPLDDWELVLPVREVIEFGPGILPTGRMLPISDQPILDFRKPRRIGATRFNHAFRGIDHQSPIGLRDQKTGSCVEIRMDSAFDFVVVYSGDAISPTDQARRGLAIEPQTCGPDAFNLGPDFGVRILAPGQVFSGSWSVTVKA
ncbi:MAG: hypothetical protein AAB425_01180 [Bdellovibrionota bacterium]